MRAFLFPGQGSQSVGMGAALAEASQAARDVFGEVDEALGQNLFLGPRSDMDDIADAFEKVYEHRDALNSACGGAHTR